MEHEHEHDHQEMFTAEFWDERYGSADRIWSGNPNPHLVRVASELTPGTALDVGSGEGADVIWLARHGWRVTGADISEVALKRAAEAAGLDLADRITWQQADIFTWVPEKAAYDLVTAHFVHLPWEDLQALHGRLAGAVKPGGTLLIVGHHPSDIEAIQRPAHVAALMNTAERLATTLDAKDWEIEATNPGRQFTDPDGNEVILHDVVVRAVKKQ
ncbi:MAG: class I SAM-dependent methyltransferase [Hamadaea sp.]|nr:class I SAM-dependent methyltransferase [Hamadaea sp.]